jgi:hypothetical protein
MKITEALKLAEKHIRVENCGHSYIVVRPYYRLADVDGPTSTGNTTDFFRARLACRHDRITSVVEAVTGDIEYANQVDGDLYNNDDGTDWRKVARQYVNEYKGGEG